MKKLLLLQALIILILLGCADVPSEKEMLKGEMRASDEFSIYTADDDGGAIRTTHGDIVVITIDDHQYILWNGGSKGGICHKEDCSNQSHGN